MQTTSPDLNCSCPIRRVQNALPVPRPAGLFVLVIDNSLSLASSNRHREDERVPRRPRVEDNLPAIRRPARRSYQRASERRKLSWGSAFAIAYPNLHGARAVGHEHNRAAVRRVPGTVILACKCNQTGCLSGDACRIERYSPYVRVLSCCGVSKNVPVSW